MKLIVRGLLGTLALISMPVHAGPGCKKFLAETMQKHDLGTDFDHPTVNKSAHYKRSADYHDRRGANTKALEREYGMDRGGWTLFGNRFSKDTKKFTRFYTIGDRGKTQMRTYFDGDKLTGVILQTNGATQILSVDDKGSKCHIPKFAHVVEKVLPNATWETRYRLNARYCRYGGFFLKGMAEKVTKDTPRNEFAIHCQEQGGQITVTGSCDCPDGREITPTVNTCLKRRAEHVETDREKFKSEVRRFDEAHLPSYDYDTFQESLKICQTYKRYFPPEEAKERGRGHKPRFRRARSARD